jgi:hypothetical protein
LSRLKKANAGSVAQSAITPAFKAAELPGSFVKIPRARRTRILFFYPSIVRYSLEEENRQLEKLHSTLKGLEKKGGQVVHCFSNFFIFSSSTANW